MIFENEYFGFMLVSMLINSKVGGYVFNKVVFYF